MVFNLQCPSSFWVFTPSMSWHEFPICKATAWVVFSTLGQQNCNCTLRRNQLDAEVTTSRKSQCCDYLDMLQVSHIVTLIWTSCKWYSHLQSACPRDRPKKKKSQVEEQINFKKIERASPHAGLLNPIASLTLDCSSSYSYCSPTSEISDLFLALGYLWGHYRETELMTSYLSHQPTISPSWSGKQPRQSQLSYMYPLVVHKLASWWVFGVEHYKIKTSQAIQKKVPVCVNNSSF